MIYSPIKKRKENINMIDTYFTEEVKEKLMIDKLKVWRNYLLWHALLIMLYQIWVTKMHF